MRLKYTSRLLFFVLLSGSIYGQSKTVLLHRLFDSLSSCQAFNGVVLVADHGKILFEKSYGYRNFAHRRPMTVDTRFEIASLSKQFTAMAAMQLYQKGLLGYNDRITQYLPDLPAAYDKITVSELIHHSSGIMDFLGWSRKQMATTDDIYTNQDIIRRLPVLAATLSFEPGTRFSYSNTNYLLLARMVAKISGLSFSEYMQTHIFQKAGMTKTSIPLSARRLSTPDDIAENYIWDPVTRKYQLFSRFAPADFRPFSGGICGPAGIKSTVRDLFNWTQAISGSVLVPDRIFAAALKPQLSVNGADTLGYDHMAYTFGWLFVPGKTPAGSFLWHNGGLGGYRSVIQFYPYINRTIVILENIDQGVAPDQLLRPIDDIVNGHSSINWPVIKPLRSSIPVDSSYLQKLTGTYTLLFNPQVKMVVTTTNNRLYARYIDQPAAELYAAQQDQFFFQIAEAEVVFRKKDGQYTELVLLLGGRKIRMVKND